MKSVAFPPQWFGDAVETYHTAIIIFFTTMICLVVSGMIVVRHWIRSQEDPHKHCRGRGKENEIDLANGELLRTSCL